MSRAYQRSGSSHTGPLFEACSPEVQRRDAARSGTGFQDERVSILAMMQAQVLPATRNATTRRAMARRPGKWAAEDWTEGTEPRFLEWNAAAAIPLFYRKSEIGNEVAHGG
jgi:hypothetical protein